MSAVSRAHCLVELAADKLRVTDLNSTNGTYIDNKRIERSEILAVGSVLRVGNVSFEHEVRTRAEMELLSDPSEFDQRSSIRARRGLPDLLTRLTEVMRRLVRRRSIAPATTAC